MYLQRGDVQKDREREEARVAEMAQNLERYKREVGECHVAARGQTCKRCLTMYVLQPTA